MPKTHLCRFCFKFFSSSKALSCHIANKESCNLRWIEFLNSLAPVNELLSIAEDEDDGIDLDATHQEDLEPDDESIAEGEDDEMDLDATHQEDLEPDHELSDIFEDLDPIPERTESVLSEHIDSRSNDDEDGDLFKVPFEGAGEIRGQVDPPFDTYMSNLRDSGSNIYYPFSGAKEWDLVVWIHETRLSLAKIDSFLRLGYVQSRAPSFRSGAALRDRIAQIRFPGPRWKAQTIVPPEGTPSEKVEFLYRDPMDVIRYLLSRPTFAEHLVFAPAKVYTHRGSDVRVYSEMYTGNWWWRTQASLPEGSTVIPVIIGSDSTHLTNFAGGKKAWPVYMSLGNIHSDVRNDPATRAWTVLAYIPQVNFLDETKIRTTLLSRVYHQCMEICLRSLVQAGSHGALIPDSRGWLRLCFPRLAANICDYPEQCLTNCAATLTSPVTTARYQELDAHKLSPPRTRDFILSQIQSACEEASPTDVPRYLIAARKRGLNGVHLPYWISLPGYQPEVAVCPDILHGVVKCWRDHLLAWSIALVGEDEYDKRLRSLQRTIGYKHFTAGIKHLSQWTCREDRELMRTHVALVAGSPKVSRRILLNLRSFHDFAYLVQYHSHNDHTLEYIDEALRIFHDTKNEFIKLGVRKGKEPHMRIPKLYGHLVFPSHIREMGSSLQYSTEIVESNHRTMTKNPYHSTNRKDFAVQMCRVLDRDDRIAHLKELIDWEKTRRAEDALISALAEYSPGYQPRAMALFEEPPDDAEERVRSRYKTSRLWLAKRPYASSVGIAYVAEAYRLPDLQWRIERCLQRLLNIGGGNVDWMNHGFRIACLDVWHKLSIRVPNVQDEDIVSILHTVEAVPPDPSLPYGRCNCVLVHRGDDAESIGIRGYQVAQVRLLFRVHFIDRLGNPYQETLAYVNWFSKPKEEPVRDILMYQVSRLENANEVIAVDSIARFVQLVPKFGSSIDDSLTTDTSLDTHRHFYVNSFADKEVYQSVW